MAMLPIAVLDMDTRGSESPLRQPDLAHHLIGIDCYALGERAPEPGDVSRARGGVPDGYAAMIVPAMVDQEHLLAHRAVIRRYLDGGGVVVFGPQARHAAAREVPAKAGRRTLQGPDGG